MRIGFCALAIFCMATGAGAATCPGQARTAAGVLATENAWAQALERRDAKALDCILGTGFADTNWRGELISRAQVLEVLPSRQPSSLSLSEMRPTLIGNVAIVRGLNTQRSGSKVISMVRFVDVFAYRSGRWQAVSAQETLVRDH